jgi:hypothetical protein
MSRFDCKCIMCLNVLVHLFAHMSCMIQCFVTERLYLMVKSLISIKYILNARYIILHITQSSCQWFFINPYSHQTIFTPWYNWKIAHFGIKQQSLTHSKFLNDCGDWVRIRTYNVGSAETGTIESELKMSAELTLEP